jgi:hypothetical protein
VFAGFDAAVPFKQFGRDGFGLRTDVGGIAAQARAIDAVLLGLPG